MPDDMIKEGVERAKAIRALPSVEELRLLRRRADLTQTQLAELLGVTRDAVAKYESGERTPRGGVALRYVDVLNQIARELGAGGHDGA